MATSDTPAELQLAGLAVSFHKAWQSWSLMHKDVRLPFKQTAICKELIEKDLIAINPNPQSGDYEVHFKGTGPIFVTSRGEQLAFTDMTFAECVAREYAKLFGSGSIQVKKVLSEW